jgi:thioredoxin reductase
VGGGNSAGHAVVYLASTAKKVWLLARRPLTETMSRYLIDRVGGLPNVEVVTPAEVTGLGGRGGVTSPPSTTLHPSLRNFGLDEGERWRAPYRMTQP